MKKKKPTKDDVSSAKEKINKAKVSDVPLKPKVTEKVMFDEHTRMFFKLRKIARRLEKDALDPNLSASRTVYALSTVYSQQREIIADIRATSDLSEQILAVEASVLDPLKRNSSNTITDAFYQLKSLLNNVCKEGELKFALETLSKIVNAMGENIDSSMLDASGQLRHIMLPEEQPKKKRKK